MTKPSCKKHTHVIALRTKNKQTLAHNRIKILSRLRPPEPLRSVTLEVNLEKVWSPLETPPAKRRRRGWSGSAQISNSSEQEVWTRLAGSDRILEINQETQLSSGEEKGPNSTFGILPNCWREGHIPFRCRHAWRHQQLLTRHMRFNLRSHKWTDLGTGYGW